MGKHKGNVGHCVHHRVELVTSLIGPTYKCHMCGFWYSTIVRVRGLAGRTQFCLDCEDKLNYIEQMLEHLKEEGLDEFHW